MQSAIALAPPSACAEVHASTSVENVHPCVVPMAVTSAESVQALTGPVLVVVDEVVAEALVVVVAVLDPPVKWVVVAAPVPLGELLHASWAASTAAATER
jgi:hypothetical protein